MLKEVYFKDKNVSHFLEYEPGLFAVCLYKDDSVHLLNRHDKVVTKLRKPGGKSCCYELCLLPCYEAETLPYVFMRDDRYLYLICVKRNHTSIMTIQAAKYESIQSYKTMEVVPLNDGEFDLLLLTHNNDQTSKIVKLHFDCNFIQAIRDKVN